LASCNNKKHPQQSTISPLHKNAGKVKCLKRGRESLITHFVNILRKHSSLFRIENSSTIGWCWLKDLPDIQTAMRKILPDSHEKNMWIDVKCRRENCKNPTNKL